PRRGGIAAVEVVVVLGRIAVRRHGDGRRILRLVQRPHRPLPRPENRVGRDRDGLGRRGPALRIDDAGLPVPGLAARLVGDVRDEERGEQRPIAQIRETRAHVRIRARLVAVQAPLLPLTVTVLRVVFATNCLAVSVAIPPGGIEAIGLPGMVPSWSSSTVTPVTVVGALFVIVYVYSTSAPPAGSAVWQSPVVPPQVSVPSVG